MEQTTERKGDDESGGADEPKNVGNGVQVYESWDDMRASWRARAEALQDEMKSFGYSSCFVACSFDAMSNDSTNYLNIWRGNYYTTLGLLADAVNDVLHQRGNGSY